MDKTFDPTSFEFPTLVVGADGDGRWAVWHSHSMATLATFAVRAEAIDAAETAADALGLAVAVEPAG